MKQVDWHKHGNNSETGIQYNKIQTDPLNVMTNIWIFGSYKKL